MNSCYICKHDFIKHNAFQLCCSLDCIRVKVTKSAGIDFKDCVKCGRRFHALRVTATHCSRECRNEKVIFPCVICGDDLPKYAARYCSKECKQVQRVRTREERNERV